MRDPHGRFTESWLQHPTLAKWARIRLPNGQTGRSLWKEETGSPRTARNIKVCVYRLFSVLYAENNPCIDGTTPSGISQSAAASGSNSNASNNNNNNNGATALLTSGLAASGLIVVATIVTLL